MALATADERGSFAATAIVPDVAPDVYSLVIVERGGISRAAFEVTANMPVAMANSTTSASVNPWTGLEAPSTGFGGPSLTEPAPAGSSGNFGIGAGLLAVGVVALASGAGVAGVRRRRAPSNSAG